MPNPGANASWPLTTSPNNCLPLDADILLGEATLFCVGDMWWSMLLLLPFVRREFRGEAGAGCGLSRDFRLLNLCGPYEASLLGRAADAVEDMDVLARLAGSWAPTRAGSLDWERDGGEVAGEVPLGDRSNLSASALTLLETCAGERVAVAVAEADDAGPEADLGVAFGVVWAPLAMGCRWRVGGMSMPW
jgi:hypothetical protein